MARDYKSLLDEIGFNDAPALPRAPEERSYIKAVDGGPTVTGQDPLSADQRQKLYDIAYENATGVTKAGLPSAKLESAAPDWYKVLAPPKNNGQLGADAAAALLSPLQAQARVSENTPLRTFKNKSRDASRGAMAGGLSALLGNMFNKENIEFDRDTNAAAKQASMMRSVGGRGTGGTSGDPLSLLRTADGSMRLEGGQNVAQDKINERTNARNPESEQSDRFRAAAAQAKLDTDDAQGRAMTAEQLDKFKTPLAQRQAQVERGQEFDRQTDTNQANKLSYDENQQAQQIDKEKRTEEQRRAESKIPGIVWVNGPPGPDAVKQVRALKGDREEMLRGSDRLQQIQGEVEKAHSLAGATGRIDQYIGKDQQKKLLAEAKLIQSKMTTAARRMDNMGVPQQFELEIQDNLNPQAGSITAFFKGPAAWSAIGKYYDESGRARISDLGGGFEGETEAQPTPQDIPTEQQIRRLPKPPVRKYGEELPSMDGPVPPMPRDAVASEPTPMYEITLPSGKKTQRPLSQAEMEKLQSKFLQMGKGEIHRVQ